MDEELATGTRHGHNKRLLPDRRESGNRARHSGVEKSQHRVVASLPYLLTKCRRTGHKRPNDSRLGIPEMGEVGSRVGTKITA
jgi:hypothetical protein